MHGGTNEPAQNLDYPHLIQCQILINNKLSSALGTLWKEEPPESHRERVSQQASFLH